MKHSKILLTLTLALVLLLGGAYVLYGRLSQDVTSNQLAVQEPSPQPEAAPTPEQTPPTEETPEEALLPLPDFTVYDREGNEVHLTDFRGKPVVANFWASWCGPCQMEMPDFEAAYQQLGEEIHFLMVNMTTSDRESLETATEFIDQQGYTFPVHYDTASNAMMTYGIYSLPTTLFIDDQGYGIAQTTGAINAETLQRGIDLIYPESALQSDTPQ